MNKSPHEPSQEEIEALATDEERRELSTVEAPEDVKTETMELIEAHGQADREHELVEDARNEP